MDKIFYSAALLLATAQGASAAVGYTSNFEFPIFDGVNGEVAGTDGWLIDNGVADISFVIASWDSGIAPASQAGALGGYFDSPGASVNLTHPVSIPLADFEFDIDFAVVSPDLVPVADNVGFSFMSSTIALLRVAFETPGGTGDLEVAWYDDLGVRHPITPIPLDIFYDSTYHLSLNVTASGADAVFNAILTGTNSFGFSGTLVGRSSEVVSGFGIDFDLVGDGDSYIVFDNVSAIPEPHTAMLAVFGLLGLAARRRRS